MGKETRKGIFPRRHIGVFKYRDPHVKQIQATLWEWLSLMRSHYKVYMHASFFVTVGILTRPRIESFPSLPHCGIEWFR